MFGKVSSKILMLAGPSHDTWPCHCSFVNLKTMFLEGQTRSHVAALRYE